MGEEEEDELSSSAALLLKRSHFRAGLTRTRGGHTINFLVKQLGKQAAEHFAFSLTKESVNERE